MGTPDSSRCITYRRCSRTRSPLWRGWNAQGIVPCCRGSRYPIQRRNPSSSRGGGTWSRDHCASLSWEISSRNRARGKGEAGIIIVDERSGFVQEGEGAHSWWNAAPYEAARVLSPGRVAELLRACEGSGG